MSSSQNKVSTWSRFLTSSKKQRWVIVITVMLVATAFIVIGYLFDQPGFPLDDSWIHQTYARNLALTGRWEYVKDELSAGSTSPLWTVLLSLGFLFGLQTPFIWTSILSISLLIGIALITYEVLFKLTKTQPLLCLGGSIVLTLDWHMLWSAASGMETILYCLLSLLILYLLVDNKNWIWIGVLAGLIVWVRPDGITFLGPILLISFWKLIKKQETIANLIRLFIPVIALVLFYGWFNYSISGKLLPNTFFAKQMEYASVLTVPLWQRLGQIFLIPVAGVGLFLIPGFLRSVRNAIVNRNVWLISCLLWFFGYGVLYAIRLPMIYQHGRYIFPLIPIFFIIGILGWHDLISSIPDGKTAIKKLVNLVLISTVACSTLFTVSGEIAFIKDLKTIRQYMLEPALWISQNTPEDSLIAVHDIGAMGYFGEREIIDLAGLIQPEIIPFIRNEQKIKEYLQNKNVDFLVVFKDWYKSMGDFGKVVVTFTAPNDQWKEEIEIRQLN